MLLFNCSLQQAKLIYGSKNQNSSCYWEAGQEWTEKGHEETFQVDGNFPNLDIGLGYIDIQHLGKNQQCIVKSYKFHYM